jgi:hypothetical protein
MQLLRIPAEYVRIVRQTLLVGCGRWFKQACLVQEISWEIGVVLQPVINGGRSMAGWTPHWDTLVQ